MEETPVIYTHDEAEKIVNAFKSVLGSDDTNDDAYADLLDYVEDRLIFLLNLGKRSDTKILTTEEDK